MYPPLHGYGDGTNLHWNILEIGCVIACRRFETQVATAAVGLKQVNGHNLCRLVPIA